MVEGGRKEDRGWMRGVWGGDGTKLLDICYMSSSHPHFPTASVPHLRGCCDVQLSASNHG